MNKISLSESGGDRMKLPPEQEAIRSKCFHPSGKLVEFPKEDVETSIPERFEKIVAEFSSRVAVKIGGNVVTYGALNIMANRVAHFILERKGPEAEPVPLLFHGGIDQIASILGVLKTGKFFVLLDASSPASRIAGIMKDLQADTLLTDHQNIELARAVASERCNVILPNSIDSVSRNKLPELAIKPSAIATVYFTSGSTGRPKGIVQSHRNFLHQSLLYKDLYKICGDDRVGVLTADATGSAVARIFMALLNGATILPFDVQKEGVKKLIGWLLREKISFAAMSSPLFRSICESLTGSEIFSDLQIIRLAGETAYKTDIDLYKKHFPPTCVLVNSLGSSETQFLTTFYMDHRTQITGDDLPVGYAVEGKEINLLDETGQGLGFNQIGEIVVRSKYLSSGYWNNQELTQAKFKPDPHDSEKRNYYTGDLGLMLPDGCLIHKGRKDGRIKIRGYGVDLNEVEAVLRGHKAIRDAVVVDRKDKSGDTRIIAYFTSLTEQAATTHELRQYLGTLLADYMIPAAFVRMEVLPLTPNGKIDRKALPEPDQQRPNLGTHYSGPRNETEADLVHIWEEVLDVHPIGIHDNFFDLGGHSLAAMRVISRVFRHFQLEISLIALLQSPTVTEMAAVINEHQGKKLSGKELERIVTELESLSDDEARKRLNESTSAVVKKE